LNLNFEPVGPSNGPPRVDGDAKLSSRPFGGITTGARGMVGSVVAAGEPVATDVGDAATGLGAEVASVLDGPAAAPRRRTGFGFAFGAFRGIMLTWS